jgi:hypothetical protein
LALSLNLPVLLDPSNPGLEMNAMPGDDGDTPMISNTERVWRKPTTTEITGVCCKGLESSLSIEKLNPDITRIATPKTPIIGRPSEKRARGGLQCPKIGKLWLSVTRSVTSLTKNIGSVWSNTLGSGTGR